MSLAIRESVVMHSVNEFHVTQSGASIPIDRWRQMCHGQFLGGNEQKV